MRRCLPLLSPLLLLTACPWDPPVSDNPLSAPPLLNTAQGTLVFTGNTSVDTTYVTVYRADDPGPPLSTGSPVTFSAVPRGAWTGEAAGQQSASWSVTQLSDGDWLFTALVDRDNDFSPLSSALAGATCGDWGGAHVTDLISATPAPVTVAGGQVVDDVTIFVGQRFSTERPAFTFVGGPPVVSKSTFGDPIPPGFRLLATGVHAAFGEELVLDLLDACAPDDALGPDGCTGTSACPCEIEGTPECATSFLVWLVDGDGDGEVDPHPGELQAAAGLKDVWPRVYLASLDEDLGTFEHDGRTVPERWVSEGYPLATAIAAAEAYGYGADAVWPVGIPSPARELDVTASSVFRHYHGDGADGVDVNGPFDLVDLRAGDGGVPEGAWSVTVVSFTGQTWTLPNEVGLVPLPSTDPTFDPATQGLVVQLTE